MSLHTDTRAVLDFLATLGNPKLEENTPEQARAGMRAALAPGEDVHEVRDLDAGGVPARLYHPSPDVTGLVVFLHGGGWVVGDLDTHDAVCRALANRSGHAVLSVDYRLAPEHRFPAAVDDATSATSWAHANASALRVDPDRLAIAGDSAGGNLAAVVANAGIVPLRFQLLVYPVTDVRGTTDSYTSNGEGYLLTEGAMRWFRGHYVDEPDYTDPRVSPALATDDALRTAPPGLVITDEFDPLRDEGEAYAARLNDLGVATTCVRFAGQIHTFFSNPAITDGELAISLAGAALRRALT